MTRLTLLLLLCSCAPAVYVPPTKEGQACKRECMSLYNQCRTAERGAIQCSEEDSACLQTCPGAEIVQ